MTEKNPATAKPVRKPSASQRGLLSRELIVETATRLIERDGTTAFTMRALGKELGVSAMAVYGYFPSRDDLLVAVLDRFMAGLDTGPVPGERWDDTMRRTMTSLYRNDIEHPQLASIEIDPFVAAQGLAGHTQRIVNLHLAQGMPEPILVQAWAFIDAFLTGFDGNAIALRKAGITPGGTKLAEANGDIAAERTPTADASAGAGNGGAGDDHEPHGRTGGSGAPEPDEAAGELAPWQRIVASAYTDEAFANGVELIIRAIRALAAPDPCDWRTPEA